MERYKSQYNFLTENFVVIDNYLFYEPNDKEANIKLKKFSSTALSSVDNLKEIPKLKKRTYHGIPIYSCFELSTKEIEKDTRTKVLKALKNQGGYELSPQDLNQFLTDCVNITYPIITKDTLLCTVQSSSNTNKQFVKKLIDKWNELYIELGLENLNTLKNIDGVLKNPNVDEIELDTNKLSISSAKEFQKILDKMKASGVFSSSKFPKSKINLVKNWLVLAKGIEEIIKDKDILIIDDFSTSGTTMTTAINLFKEIGAKNIAGLVLIREV